MANEIPEQHCSRWGGIPQHNLNDDNRLHIQMLVESFRSGPWNLPVTWDRVEWGQNCYTAFNLGSSLSTFDFDRLTRLIILAHEYCVRVEISPCNMQYIKVEMWTRKVRSHRGYHIHPNIETAVFDLRKSIR